MSRREGAAAVLPTPLRPSDPGAGRLLSVTATAHPGGRVVVEAVGEVDSYTAPLLELCLGSRAAQPGVRHLLVDLTGVSFLGAAGMAVLAEAAHDCRRRGARLAVRSGGRRSVVHPLEVAGLADSVGLDADVPRRRRGAQSPARPRRHPRRAAARRAGRPGR
jgi:anti-anti-sigma factor